MKLLANQELPYIISLNVNDEPAVFTGFDESKLQDRISVGKYIPVYQKILKTADYLAWTEPYISQRASVIIYDNMVKVLVSGKQPKHLRGARRGQVNMGFDGKPRKRFLDAFNSWRMGEGDFMFMLTLTYPDIFPMDWRKWKDDLERFREDLLLHFPDCEGFWRLEQIDRKSGENTGLLAPHFHLVIKLNKEVTTLAFKRFVTVSWARIAHRYDKNRGAYATRCDKIKSPRHALNYAGKYCTKWSAEPIDPRNPIDKETGEYNLISGSDLNVTIGRQWGKIGKPDCSPSAIYTCHKKDAQALYEVLLKMKIQAKDSNAGLKRANSLRSWTAYNIGDNPKPHEYLYRPAFPPAATLMTHIKYRVLSKAKIEQWC